MLRKRIEGIQKIDKGEKVYYILHTITVDDVDRDGFVGKMCENIFANEGQLPADLKVGSVVRVYYDNVGGKAYLSGIEVCK